MDGNSNENRKPMNISVFCATPHLCAVKMQK